MPDYFVPIDRGDKLNGYYAIANTSALIQFTFHYTNEHKAELQKQYPDISSFLNKMTVTDALLNQLVNYYVKNTKQKTPKLSAEDKKELKIWLKALIGRNLYGDEAFYPVINASDKVILKALEVIK